MKVFASLLLLSVLVMIAVDAYVPPVRKPKPNVPSFPTFSGQGSFNPYARPIRFRRSLEEEPGKIHISGGVKKQSGRKPEIHVGGSIHKG